MTTMNVSIPESMKRSVEQQTHSGRYANASDDVRHLIRCDQERTAKIAHSQARVTKASKAASVADPWTSRRQPPAVIRARPARK